MASIAALITAAIGFELFYKPREVRVGWRSQCDDLERNQLGMRGQTIEVVDGERRVVLVGDSQVQANGCAFGWMPERRLQLHLRKRGVAARVFSLGAGGWGQDQQLLVLREYFARFDAALVLLWFTPENDVWNNTFPTHWPVDGTPKPTFWLAGDALLGPHQPMGVADAEGEWRLWTFVRRHVLPRGEDEAWAARHLPPAYQPLVAWSGPVARDWQERWQADEHGFRAEDFGLEKTHFQLRLQPPSPRTRYSLRLTGRLLAAIRDLCDAHGADFSVFRALTPQGPAGISEEVQQLHGRHYRVSGPQQEALVDALLEPFAPLGIEVTTRPFEMGPGDAHLNQHSVDQLMRDLAPHVAARLRARRGRQ